jgi:kinesin family protein 18/19
MLTIIRYVFDHVFQMDTTQEEVFEKTAKPLLPGVLDGYNATVFAYGVSHFNSFLQS